MVWTWKWCNGLQWPVVLCRALLQRWLLVFMFVFSCFWVCSFCVHWYSLLSWNNLILYCNLLVIRCVHIDCLKRTDAVWNGQAHRKNWKVFLKTVSKRQFQTWDEENKLSDHMFLYLNYTISPYPRSSSFLQRLTVRSIARRGSFIIIYLKQIINLKK